MAIKPVLKHTFYKNDGTRNALGKVYTYVAGTTTPTSVFTTSAGDVAHSNPIILDSHGECEFWVVGLIKVNCEETNDNGATYSQVTGWPVDNVGSGVTNDEANARWAGTATGTANALAIAPSPAITAYAVGQSFIFKSGASANTTATTISISGLSAIAVQSNGAACSGGEILANNWYQIVLSTAAICQISKIGEPTLAELGAASLAGTSTQVFSCETPTAATHAVPADALQLQSATHCGTTGGTSTAYTCAATPAIAANTAKTRIRATLHTAAGATPTLAVNGLTALAIKYLNASAAETAITSTQGVSGWSSDFEINAAANAWIMLDIPSAGGAAAGANADITSMSAVTALTTTGGIDIIGTNTNDSAASGYVGEYVSSTVAQATSGLTTNTTADVTSISLTAGDWDVGGSIVIGDPGTTSFTSAMGGISATTATLPATNLRALASSAASVPGGVYFCAAVPVQRINIASTTTYYLVARAGFTVSTAGAGGVIWARRRR